MQSFLGGMITSGKLQAKNPANFQFILTRNSPTLRFLIHLRIW
jgi:hypothetical protein